MVQAPRITGELNPFRSCFCTLFQDFLHQSANEPAAHPGTKQDRFSGWRMLNQNCRAKTHVVSRSWTVSSYWSHSRQRAGWGSPLFCKRSAVQHRLRMASQMKVLHLLGAQDFQSRFHGSKLTDPAKKALYADLEEKFPEASNFQWWVSSVPCKITSVSTSQRSKYSTRPCQPRAPRMSDTQVSSCKASFTVLAFLNLAGMHLKTLGARFSMLQPGPALRGVELCSRPGPPKRRGLPR